ncbi:RING-H2 finger protein ATL56-like [Zingiber officinale]|uniref:RING-H2 finger protein ATL56-like n=1 Tax=Zingiber officinale TaxID=94328 RepID=UPI001C4C0565|nr:RING-H2 finger protein ATL56-like [Zingiber officinale]XP_042388557.1 RING-H2 finger protein ATL56-like [Zingiber officinale]XP_042388558.1 RING-H2 finger protein ATL56-like [Zingiber officinale]
MAQIDHRRSLLAAEIYVDEAARPVTDAASAAEAAKPGGGARVLSFFLQTFVMAVALVLFFIFAGVAAVFLLHLCVVGRAFRSRRRSVGPAATDRIPRDARPGLSDAQMKDLPWFEYVVRSACSQWPPPECAVCMEGVRMGERCRALPPCGHVFHVSCVDRWLVRSPSCPICRACVGAVAAEPPVGRPLGLV